MLWPPGKNDSLWGGHRRKKTFWTTFTFWESLTWRRFKTEQDCVNFIPKLESHWFKWNLTRSSILFKVHGYSTTGSAIQIAFEPIRISQETAYCFMMKSSRSQLYFMNISLTVHCLLCCPVHADTGISWNKAFSLGFGLTAALKVTDNRASGKLQPGWRYSERLFAVFTSGWRRHTHLSECVALLQRWKMWTWEHLNVYRGGVDVVFFNITFRGHRQTLVIQWWKINRNGCLLWTKNILCEAGTPLCLAQSVFYSSANDEGIYNGMRMPSVGETFYVYKNTRDRVD